MATDVLQGAVQATREVLVNVRSEQLDGPTPCAKWDVRELINHIVGVPAFFGAVPSGETPSGDAPDFASGDFVKSFDEASARCVAAYANDDVLGREFDLQPIGKVTGAVCLTIATNDIFVHGWDLARATGQSTDLDPGVAASVLETAKASLPAEYRNEEGSPFAFEKQAPPGASAADQLAAYMGRDV